jgi:hypothetical protein
MMVADPQGEIAQPSADVILWQGCALPLRGGADDHAMTGFGGGVEVAVIGGGAS